MEKILNLYKKVGETPLERLERFRLENSEYKDVKMSYAGRLDPMADGVLLVLVGEECKNRQEYLELAKEYSFDVLWEIETDTYDILGKIISVSDFSSRIVSKEISLEKFKGKILQKYPPYSSKTIDGVPLFELARKNILAEDEIPTREVEIYELAKTGDFKISKKDLSKMIFDKISLVKGDFRQDEIKDGWEKFFAGADKDFFDISSFKIKASSGTYVRSLVNQMGDDSGCGAIALRITREKIEGFKIEDSMK